jgi:hypothetical protein
MPGLLDATNARLAALEAQIAAQTAALRWLFERLPMADRSVFLNNQPAEVSRMLTPGKSERVWSLDPYDFSRRK